MHADAVQAAAESYVSKRKPREETRVRSMMARILASDFDGCLVGVIPACLKSTRISSHIVASYYSIRFTI